MKRKKLPLEKHKNAEHWIDYKQQAGGFNLDFLDPSPNVAPTHYEEVLLTAEEKAEYYEEILRNGGREDFVKIAEDCKLRAHFLKKKIAGIDPFEVSPVIEEITWLKTLADHYDNAIPQDVLDSQIEAKSSGFELTLELEKKHSEMGLGELSQTDSNPSALSEPNAESERIKELKHKASFWRNIHSWKHEETLNYYFCGSKKPVDWVEVMFVRAQNDKQLAVKMLSSEIEQPLQKLLKLAEMGNEPAALSIISILERFVTRLNATAKLNQKTFKKVGSKLLTWPVIYSPHPKLDQTNATVAKDVSLGDETEFEFWPGAEWNPRDTACRIAIALYRHIDKIRKYPDANAGSSFFKEANELPNIKTANGVKAWWQLAQRIFHTSFPDPQREMHLGGLTKLKNRGKANSKIREIIKNRFFSLFKVEYR